MITETQITDEEVTLENVTLLDGMYWFHFSNGLHIVLGMSPELVPPIGTEMLLVYPNEQEVWVHWPVFGRVHSLKFKRGFYCI